MYAETRLGYLCDLQRTLLFKIKIASAAEGQSYKTGCALSINWSHTD